MNAKRPNLLWYCTDQQRFDTIRALGNEYVRTPVLDQLVSEGTAYSRILSKSYLYPESFELYDWALSVAATQHSQRERHFS